MGFPQSYCPTWYSVKNPYYKIYGICSVLLSIFTCSCDRSILISTVCLLFFFVLFSHWPKLTGFIRITLQWLCTRAENLAQWPQLWVKLFSSLNAEPAVRKKWSIKGDFFFLLRPLFCPCFGCSEFIHCNEILNMKPNEFPFCCWLFR